MAPIDLGSYKSIYLQTAKEYINKMSISLGKLSTDILDKEALNNLHIASHSLKSQSQVMGFNNIASICLEIENMSTDALQGTTQLNNQSILDIKKQVEELDGILRSTQDDTGTKV